MDKNNKHHKNKAKDSKKLQSLPPSLSASLEPVGGKIEEATASAQKPKSSKGKQK